MDANQIIDSLGGTAETARICDVSMPSVSEWRAKNKIPQARLMYLQLLRPEVFSGEHAGSTNFNNQEET
jgi:hypothetical protein